MEIWTAVWDAFNAPLFSLGADPVTPLSLVVLVLIFAVTWFVAGRVRWVLEDHIGNRVEDIPEGVLHVIGNLARYTIIFMGSFIGLRSVGFQLDAVLVVFGALGVGMGFGLQNIANNFVSGVILLVERPIKVGDVVSVAGELGTVERVGIRATTLRKFDQTQAIVPNGELISTVVNNWTLDDRRVRVDFVVGVAYGSDTRLVERLIREAVTEHELVLDDPEPRIFFFEFGDSSLNFRVLAYVADISERFGTLSDLHFTIDEEFRAHDIEIPFPQRDLHLRSIDSDVAVRHTPTVSR
ncbi:MAG: mechanosensitive ion channel [Chloroflexota bacterium]|nr:mechanosensitive ion channel [Chloroflexota bacterium]